MQAGKIKIKNTTQGTWETDEKCIGMYLICITVCVFIKRHI